MIHTKITSQLYDHNKLQNYFKPTIIFRMITKKIPYLHVSKQASFNQELVGQWARLPLLNFTSWPAKLRVTNRRTTKLLQFCRLKQFGQQSVPPETRWKEMDLLITQEDRFLHKWYVYEIDIPQGIQGDRKSRNVCLTFFYVVVPHVQKFLQVKSQSVSYVASYKSSLQKKMHQAQFREKKNTCNFTLPETTIAHENPIFLVTNESVSPQRQWLLALLEMKPWQNQASSGGSLL